MYRHDNITLIILAGELGTRVSTLVPDKSKVLAPVNGRPFVSYLLDQISRAGLRKVILCTGYKIGEVKQTFRDAHSGVSLIYSHESSPSGTGEFLHYDLLLIKRRYVLAMNGDSYINIDFANCIDWFSYEKI